MQLSEAEKLGCPANDASLGLHTRDSNGMVFAIKLKLCDQINEGNATSSTQDQDDPSNTKYDNNDDDGDAAVGESLSEAGWTPARLLPNLT